MKKIKVRPGRAQSAAGFAAGLVFVGIGLFVVIPAFGLFGIAWTLVAVIITCVNAVNVFSQKGVATSEIVIEDDGQPAPAAPDCDPALRLERLRSLYESGHITREEYEKRRAEIIGEI